MGLRETVRDGRYRNGLARIRRVNHGEDQPGGFSSMVFDRSNGIYRSVFAATVGWLILVGNTPNQQRVLAPSPSPEKEGNKGTSQSQKAPAPLPVSIIETPELAVASQSRETKSNQHYAGDLDAQIRAADAAEDQIFSAWVAAFLSFIGTLLIVWTLCETRRGNRISAKEYARSRIEVRKAHELATTTADRQLRPYLAVEEIVPQEPCGESQRITILVKNFGQTPAQNVIQKYGIAFCPIGTEQWPVTSSRIQLGREIAPSHHQKAVLDLIDWRDEWQIMMRGEGTFRIILIVEYEGLGVARQAMTAPIIYSIKGAAHHVTEMTGSARDGANE